MVEANPDLMKRPLRERLIHMLAIRSYKKPELVNRLHRGKTFCLFFLPFFFTSHLIVWLTWNMTDVSSLSCRFFVTILIFISVFLFSQRVSKIRTRNWLWTSCLPSAWWKIKRTTWRVISGTTCTTTGHFTRTRRSKSSKGIGVQSKWKSFFFRSFILFCSARPFIYWGTNENERTKKKPVLYLCVCHGYHSFSVRW